MFWGRLSIECLLQQKACLCLHFKDFCGPLRTICTLKPIKIMLLPELDFLLHQSTLCRAALCPSLIEILKRCLKTPPKLSVELQELEMLSIRSHETEKKIFTEIYVGLAFLAGCFLLQNTLNPNCTVSWGEQPGCNIVLLITGPLSACLMH